MSRRLPTELISTFVCVGCGSTFPRKVAHGGRKPKRCATCALVRKKFVKAAYYRCTAHEQKIQHIQRSVGREQLARPDRGAGIEASEMAALPAPTNSQRETP